jgi:hypothetical protein
MFVAGVDAYSKVGLEDLAGGVRVVSVVSKPQAAFWASLSTPCTEGTAGPRCAPWVMSPSGQSNLLLIRRLLHPSIPDFDPIRNRFFAQVLPKFSVVRSHKPRLRTSAPQCVVLNVKRIVQPDRRFRRLAQGPCSTKRREVGRGPLAVGELTDR